MVQVAEDRPPYVTFEVRAVEDRQASIEQGRFVGRDVVYALITPMGSKDRIEQVASEWLQQLERDSREGRFPQAWLDAFKGAHKAFLEGREAPLNGTRLADWPGISPAQYRTLESLGVRTIEDLASANEELLMHLGMGGRSLKQRAQDWLQNATKGISSEELSSFRVLVEQLQAKNEQLEADNKRLLAIVEAQGAEVKGTAKAQKL